MFYLLFPWLLYGSSISSLAIAIYYTYQFKIQIADLELKMLADSLKLKESIKEQIRGGFDFHLREVSKKKTNSI